MKNIMLSVAVLSASFNGFAQHTLDSVVRAVALSYLQNPASAGVSIGVFTGAQTCTWHFGEVEKGTQRPPSDHTLYRIGSITKTFTGCLLAEASLEKKLGLGDDIRKYLQGDYPNLAYNGQPILVGQLLNHRSGLPYMLPEDTAYLTSDTRTQATLANHLYETYTKSDFFSDLHKVRLDTVPGTKFRYSNAAAQLAGYILERMYHKSYDELLEAEITGPLHMPDTKIALSKAGEARMAKGYDASGMQMPHSPNQFEGAGAIKSDIVDMLKYARWQLSENSPVVALSHQPTFTVGNYSAGLNWQIIRTTGTRLIWQSGDLPGFTSYCVLYPELHIAVVVLTNEEDRTAPGRIEKMINAIAKTINPLAVSLP